MFTVFEITKPRFKSWGVVFADRLAVGDNVRFTGYRSPFASGIEEGNIDLGV